MSTATLEQTQMRLSVLMEVGNIGAGNAMTALSTLIDRGVAMSVPHVGLVKIYDFIQMAGGPEARAAGVYMRVEGDAPGHVAFMMPASSACYLANQLLDMEITDLDSLDEMSCSALMEIGNILASSYLVAIGEMTGLNLLSSPPGLAIDMTSAILSEIAATFADNEEQVLTIVTHIGEPPFVAESNFIYVPDAGSLTTMLRALQMDI